MRRSFLVYCLIIAVVIGGIGYKLIGTDQHRLPVKELSAQSTVGVVVGKIISPFTLDNIAGQSVEVGKPGKPYVLNFWASWCPPCRGEFPELDMFARSHVESAQFYAVNLQESAEKAKLFLNQNGYTVSVLLDKDGTVAHTFQVTAIPTTLVVDSQGIIRYRKSGPVTLDELEEVMKGL